MTFEETIQIYTPSHPQVKGFAHCGSVGYGFLTADPRDSRNQVSQDTRHIIPPHQ